MKQLVLPTPADNSPAPVLPDSPSIVIIGANGAGKSRFAKRLCRLAAPDAISLSALSALYSAQTADAAGDYFDRLFLDSTVPTGEKQRPQTRLERLLAMLMNDELIMLLNRKIKAHSGNGSPDCAPYEATRLDSLIDIFHDIFPDNSILVEKGNFSFKRPGSDDRYPTMRLSDGERTVLYYTAALLYAPQNAYVFVESPEIFLHPTTVNSLWNRLELLRPDCRFVYTTHDLGFASSRTSASIIWVRGWDFANDAFDYKLLDSDSPLGEDIYMAIMGARRDVLFVEGDRQHSIDSRLYSLLFRDFTVKPVGSCNRVIEATRTFNSLNDFHHLKATGIVDRDRRAEGEVDYLRRRNILVPDVAEIENILMLEDIVRAVAADRGRDPERVVSKVRRAVISLFERDLRSQALEHTRHTMKKTVEYRVDGRFPSISQLETHIARLCIELNPRGTYENFCRDFHRLVDDKDYEGILRVYNHKSMIAASNLPALCGFDNKDRYVAHVLGMLGSGAPGAEDIRRAALRILRAVQ